MLCYVELNIFINHVALDFGILLLEARFLIFYRVGRVVADYISVVEWPTNNWNIRVSNVPAS